MKENYPQIVDETYVNHWDLTLSNEEYHSDKTAANFSSIKELEKSEQAFYFAHVLGKRPKPTSAFHFGTAVHMAILQPDLFKEKFVLMPKFQGEGSMKARASFKAGVASRNAMALTEDENEDLQGMLNSVMRHTEACNILKKGEAEHTGYFKDPDTGIKCRIRPDFYSPRLNALVDVKTTRSCEMSEFSKTIWNYKYHFQMAMYSLGCELITGKKVEYPLYLAIEKTAPYECALYLADDAMMLKGLTSYQMAMSKLKRCIETEIWTGYQTKHQSISLPNWALMADKLTLGELIDG